MKEIIEKYFKDEHLLYFQSSDAYQGLVGDSYLRHQWHGNRVVLWLGSTNFEEVPIKVCSTPADLEKLIRTITY